MRGLVGALDGSEILTASISGKAKDAEQLGISLAKKLLDQGAKAILDEVYANDEHHKG